MSASSGELRLRRRDVLKGAAAVIVAIQAPVTLLAAGEGHARLPTRVLDPTQLDTWLAVDASGRVTAYWGKMDMGQGVTTAIAQIIAEELGVLVQAVDVIAGDSGLCVDQGGASGSTGVASSGLAFRAAAAEARLVLLRRAAAVLGAEPEALSVANGVVSVTVDPSRSIGYARLIGDRPFETSIGWNGEYGNDLALAGRATPKKPSEYRIVGTSVPRKDIRGKILGATEYLHDRQLPGMLHGRVVRPPVAGAHVRSVDRRSVGAIAGVSVVVERDFVGVVAEHEWDAIRAAERLTVEWDESGSGFPTTSEHIFDWIRAAEPAATGVVLDEGDVDRAMETAAATLEASYEWPFQSHARMAPAAAIADVRDGEATIWTDSQKPWDTRTGAAKLLSAARPGRAGRPTPRVRSIWMPGPGSYGRSDAGDGAMDAVVLSEAVGAPVRVQWMRRDGHAWDPKGPASVVHCRAGIDAGRVIAYDFHIKGFSRHDQSSRENDPSEVLAGHLLGYASTPRWSMNGPADSYRFENKRYGWTAVPPLRLQASPLRTSHFRDPYGPEVHFASESFIDEMAYATGTDPLEFRLQHAADERDRAVLEAAADLAEWQPRRGPTRRRERNGLLVGTGIACAQRNGSVNAVAAEVEVDPRSGRVRVRRMWVGADHGLVVNPFTLDRTIEGNLLQATSRTLFEEVRFDEKMVRSEDWSSYPVLGTLDAPDEILIRQIDRPELGPRGAGEPTTRVTPPAIANAFFDATGVRLRRVPFTPERVSAALRHAEDS